MPADLGWEWRGEGVIETLWVAEEGLGLEVVWVVEDQVGGKPLELNYLVATCQTAGTRMYLRLCWRRMTVVGSWSVRKTVPDF